MIQLDDENKIWTKKHHIRIPYFHNGFHNYVPDFLVDTIYLEEIKPKNLLNLKLNKIKFKAGKKYCKENNLNYLIITENILKDYLSKALIIHNKNKLN